MEKTWRNSHASASPRSAAVRGADLNRWIAQLDSDRFAERERATRTLAEAGGAATGSVPWRAGATTRP